MGKVSSLPVTEQFKSSAYAHKTEDPFVIADAIRKSNAERKKMPTRRVFGNDHPASMSTVSPLQAKRFE